MNLHRIFIAINLPDEMKDQLLGYKQTWSEVPARWVSKDNLHLTLAFLGNTSDHELTEVCKLMQAAGERHKPFTVNINHIVYGPDTKRPRMIWALLEKSSELLALQKEVETTLQRSENLSTSLSASQPFSPHLTLARLKTFELQRMEAEEIPEVNEQISLSFVANSFEVMESTLKRSGAKYSILQSCPLENQATNML